MPEQLRLIKKYPNRRLYDTKTSAYITLTDVKDLVLAREIFNVVDAKTGEDITRAILLQIILEEEASGVPLFTADLLAQMIRFYGHAMQGMLGKYLETNIKSFVDFQKKLQEQSQSLYGESNSQMQSDMWSQFMNFQGPAMQTMMSTYMEQSRKMLHQMQDQLKTQTRTLFNGIPLPGFPVDSSKQPHDSEK
ncbi:MAG: polyhydroxyalkanoate synthesis repressor PhaR [Candidatus Accumulibacter regalis]|jgi:polyhydroxyalkanoate synthesis repressor PhaR|uniref:Polyhydroxyalkanoate synthesis repressor PhaR n=2 Tax=Candidatus Accumulibacter TaxID=327159 RepID=A0A011P6U3_ACCRE|nr:MULTISPECIES: polyhydroxyalkanoate synthesis repressor PhaR [unclassified Candidatus Accumulibacter]EXI80932.1 MAG: polyhydroxyalkanoate synthesis repressor PhaR [Candidatus Accumulibacter appositus]EXI90688.1 MAG: polyhydroxyalkanoate synthesis repressor PhaR [Candidatus Accumulibacter regalis]MBL8366798.1 polyhydroxyalkanoate synthesis repressor PhaR [Accumulibacter sp.]MBN8513559.1 polyhydroxyalkanoate synthesis repressor PhaR [Accumulibacter sp.]HRE69139.1 polyhydroxyalkanoate synthesis